MNTTDKHTAGSASNKSWDFGWTYVLAVVLIAAVVVWIASRSMPLLARGPLAWAGIYAGAFLAIGAIPGVLRGVDLYNSTSKLQTWLWGVALAYGLIGYLLARSSAGLPMDNFDVPEYLLTAVGFSITTGIGAKLIARDKSTARVEDCGARSDRVEFANVRDEGESVSAPRANLRDFVTDDHGRPDVQKLQLLLWTVFAVGLYIYLTHMGITDAVVEVVAGEPGFEELTASEDGKTYKWDSEALEKMPELPLPLLLLAGLGQVAYIGDKLVRVTQPRIDGVEPEPERGLHPGSAVSLLGAGFDLASSKVVFDDVFVVNPVVSATSIEFRVPAKRSDGTDWDVTRVTEVGVRVISGGVRSNEVRLKIAG